MEMSGRFYEEDLEEAMKLLVECKLTIIYALNSAQHVNRHNNTNEE